MNFSILEKIVIRAHYGSNYCAVFHSVRTFSGMSLNKVISSIKRPFPNKIYEKHNVDLHVMSAKFKDTNVNEPEVISENISLLNVKKPLLRKRKYVIKNVEKPTPGFWITKALATAEAYNLERLTQGLEEQQLYEPHTISTTTKSLPDVIHAVARYDVEKESREIFFFREGTIVMWNMPELECGNLLEFLKPYEENSYSKELVQAESEVMKYTYTEAGKESHLKHGNIMLSPTATSLDKYTFSNAIAQSVKLGIWETSLHHYIESIEYVTEDLKTGRKLRMSQALVLRKQGELFALRHLINLSSDLLDTPDFYWERDDLEQLYQRTCAYFDIAKRTRVMNEKLNHCLELIGILSSHLSDRHHIRLEWMIIVLIMVEVAFEVLHYIDRYLVK